MANDASNKGSQVKNLVVTAAVASLVSALVSPWVRRWMDAVDAPGALPAKPPPPDDFNARLERLLDLPESFSPETTATVSRRSPPETHGNTKASTQ